MTTAELPAAPSRRAPRKTADLVVRFGDNMEILDALDRQAGAAGVSREALIREVLTAKAGEPIIYASYGLDAYYPGGVVSLHRADSGAVSVHHVCTAYAENQGHAIEAALYCMANNQPGDREEAISILRSVFPRVHETAR